MTDQPHDQVLPFGSAARQSPRASETNVERSQPVFKETKSTDPAGQSKLSARQVSAGRSALWAAWGDAVGWTSELTDERGLRRRTRGRPLDRPLEWSRKVGGRNGVTVAIPAGTYSDDTQLRLGVGRSYGPAGFDPEVFSAVELTVWPSYALGGGLATKAAASSMVRGGARWSANQRPDYLDAGGNGAAMRAQPHGWHAQRPIEALLRDVLRDAVSTHGHPYALVGASLSALAVAEAMPDTLARHEGPDAWIRWISTIEALTDVARDDPELSAYWLPNWQHPALGPWDEALKKTLAKAALLAGQLGDLTSSSRTINDGYRSVVELLGIRDESVRGSGLHTVLGALALVELARVHRSSPSDALLCAVHELGTDTDTIATMAGSVLGCEALEDPPGPLMDREYLRAEASRVAAPGGPGRPDFIYPDLLTWEPPRTQADALVQVEGQLAVRGLGIARSLGDPMDGPSEFAWQWVELQTTQTLLIKRRRQLPQVTSAVLPTSSPTIIASAPSIGATTLADTSAARSAAPEAAGVPQEVPNAAGPSSALEGAVARVRASNYDVRMIGIHLARLARTEGAPVAAAFGALVAADLAAMKDQRGSSHGSS